MRMTTLNSPRILNALHHKDLVQLKRQSFLIATKLVFVFDEIENENEILIITQVHAITVDYN